ncbi:RagB/SusD family nutrient uptake outer membrane protein [Sphingobacterium sp. ML3W]|uniref:RagB/SusD family nutrient uptake outer membrane protein n=1 Tax=Sphingobacterium sp. ML3W TaxID=1538644 RepID=UPI00249BD2CF|nr:RagB/SusD family nutrient uptake outer membrane protein [Sphingobacterium sp. ML3W]WFA78102.1 RagB/SusD family nutrient uptake outer membrane protein [Sphingobacterium sp. ML3W]
MKFKYILSLIGISGMILFNSSCSKYLDLKPENSTYDEVFWKDGENVNRATLGAYALLRNSLRADRSYFIFGDIASGIVRQADEDWNMDQFARSGGYKFSYAPYLEGSLWNWTRFYGIINQCNLIVEQAEAMDIKLFDGGEDEKKGYIANARFLRAYTYFYMQRVWGDVLLVKETFKNPQNIPDMTRTPEKETLAFCKEDLLYAIANLQQNPTKSFASKGAANALMAEVCAWEHDYINAEKYANETLKFGYSLEDVKDYRKIWKGNSKESIFELNMLYSESGNEFTEDFFSRFLSSASIPGKGSGSVWDIEPEFLETEFDKPEARLDSMSMPFPDNAALKTIRKYDDIVEYREGKYAVSNNLVLIRLADIILLRAEAYYKNGKTTLALNDLNTIRKRAGLEEIQVSGAELFKEIFRERRRELIGEGVIQFDLIRMNMFEQLDEYSAYYSADRIANKGYYWPLDMRNLLPQNELLTQNPWWKNH